MVECEDKDFHSHNLSLIMGTKLPSTDISSLDSRTNSDWISIIFHKIVWIWNPWSCLKYDSLLLWLLHLWTIYLLSLPTNHKLSRVVTSKLLLSIHNVSTQLTSNWIHKSKHLPFLQVKAWRNSRNPHIHLPQRVKINISSRNQTQITPWLSKLITPVAHWNELRSRGYYWFEN